MYGGLSASERRDDRKARLLEAGLEYFGTIGFAKTTIPMLCSAAGVTARNFYDDFESREALLKALYDDIAQNVFDLFREPLRARDKTVRERIRASNEAYFRYMTGDPRRARIYAVESRGISAEFELRRRAMLEERLKSMTKATQRLEQVVSLDAIDSRLLSVAIAGAARALLREWVLAARRPSVEKMIDTLTALWMRTLQIERLGKSFRLPLAK